MSWLGTVLLLRSFVLVEVHFSCAGQGGGMGCVVEVLIDF